MTKRTRGTGSLIQRGNIWWMQYCQDGQVFRESTGSPLKTVAEIKLRKRLTEIEHGKFRGLAAEKMTVEKMVERLLAKKENGELKHTKSIEWDKTRWTKHLKPALGHLEARKVTEDRLSAYIAARKAEKKPAGPATINRELALLRRAFKIHPHVPCPVFPHLEEPAPRQGFLSDEARERLAVECAKTGLWLRAIFEIGSRYGFRKGELLNLRVKNVDLAERVLRLEGRDTKNGEVKEVPLLADAFVLVQQCVIGKTAEDFVFTRQDGQPVKDFRKVWKNVCTAASVPNLKLHDLRRTAVSNLVHAGVDRKTAMSISGHLTESTFTRYHIVDRVNQIAALEKVYKSSTDTNMTQQAPEARQRPN